MRMQRKRAVENRTYRGGGGGGKNSRLIYVREREREREIGTNKRATYFRSREPVG